MVAGHSKMHHLTTAALALVALLLFSGCAARRDEGLEQAPPPDAIAIRVYTLGGDEKLKWLVDSLRAADQWGVVTTPPEATCILVSPGWRLEVSIELPGEPARPQATAVSGDFSVSSPLDLSIERTPDGSVVIGEGVPEWWSAKPQACST